MLPAAKALIAELDAETATTRRVLERVPDDRLTWQPHAKSMTLGQLAQHVALIPGNISRMAAHDSIDMATRKMEYPAGESTAAILATLDASVTAASWSSISGCSTCRFRSSTARAPMRTRSRRSSPDGLARPIAARHIMMMC